MQKKVSHFSNGWYLNKEQASLFTHQLFIWMIPVHIPAFQYLVETALIECIDPTSIARLTLESANIQSNQGLGRLAYDARRSQVTDKIQPPSNDQRRLL